MLILRHRSLIPEITGRRTYFFDIFRRTYEPRGGLRTLKDLKKEELEFREGRHPDQDPTKYTILGNKKVTPLEMLHYSDRVSGKGYSSYANHSYDRRPYIWPPLRVTYKWLYAGTLIFMVFALVDFEGIYNYIKYKIDQKTPEASTLKEPTDESFEGDGRVPEDFVRSLTPGVMQPRNLGLDKFKTFTPNQVITADRP